MSLDSDRWQEMARRHLAQSAEVKQMTSAVCLEAITQAALLIVDSLKLGGKLLLCGNGGSAADCQHIASEFTSVLDHTMVRSAMAALALTTDTSFLTANANDFGFEGIFARQVEALGRPDDVLIGVSTSGNSANVVRALETAQQQQLHTVLLAGESGGKAGEFADVAIRIPSRNVQHIQEAHIAVGHILCALAERSLFDMLWLAN